MGRGNALDDVRPEYLFSCPEQFFDSAVLCKTGLSWKQCRVDGDVEGRREGEGGGGGGSWGAKEVGRLSIEEGERRDGGGGGLDGKERETETGRIPSELSARWTCNGCKASFQSSEDQRAHFKSDYHRLNVKRRVVGKEPINEEEFVEVAEGQWRGDNDDVSSISGSDVESDDPEHDSRGTRHMLPRSNRIFFLLQDIEETISIWRSLLLADKEYLPSDKGYIDEESVKGLCVTDDKLLLRLKSLIKPRAEGNDKLSLPHVWIVLLAAGGHFAGVVVSMDKGVVLSHHTFHRYVVRAKAGGRQSTRDATGRAPKSAGASLRRYNEQALQKEIRDLLASWSDYLRSASHIFVHAPSANGQALFGGENAPLDRNDSRLRRIPFTTRRPTFKEAKRVYHLLAAITYEQEIPSVMETPSGAADGKSGVKKAQKAAMKEVKHSGEALEPGKGNAEAAKQLQRTEDLANLDENKSTPLHEAAKSGNCEVVLKLLEEGLDPCARDGRDRTPYALAGDKETRNVFRRFMAAHPEKWDWHDANVPSALTEEMEAAQIAKQGEKNAKKKEREKERKKQRKEQERAEQAEKKAAELAEAALANVRGTSLKKFSKGSSADTKSSAYQEAVAKAQAQERDARAAAAEARFRALAANKASSPSQTMSSTSGPGSSSTTAKLCSCCGTSLTGKTPFYRLSYQYCSTTCVHVHRKILAEDE